jgi:hypothetical protein
MSNTEARLGLTEVMAQGSARTRKTYRNAGLRGELAAFTQGTNLAAGRMRNRIDPGVHDGGQCRRSLRSHGLAAAVAEKAPLSWRPRPVVLA